MDRNGLGNEQTIVSPFSTRPVVLHVRISGISMAILSSSGKLMDI